MLPFLACLVATQVPVGQPPRLRTILPNGASILVERVPGAKSLSLELFASSRGTEETPLTNGLRHLMEHLVARGPKGDIDDRLETAGGFLSAETLRDAMCFKLTLPPGKLSMGLKILEELMHMPEVTPEEIQHEALIIGQEAALRTSPSAFSAAAWTQAFGDRGLDVVGNLDVIKNATPEMLAKIHRTQFSGPNLAIAVAGDVELDPATAECANVLSKAAPGTAVKADRRPGTGGDVSVTASGEAVAVPVPGWRDPETAARLAAAFALASEADQCYVVYTPSANPGLVLLGQNSVTSGLHKLIEKASANELYTRGRELARAWIRSLLDSPASIVDTRGLLMVEEVDLKPETLLENLDVMSPKMFADALNEFRSHSAVTLEGK